MKTETPPTQFTIADLWKELSKAMKTVEETPTADLIAELRELEKNAKTKPVSLEHVYARQVSANRHSDICYELDRRCVNANMESDGKGNLKTPCSIELPLAEFCLLCEWLLMKEGVQE